MAGDTALHVAAQYGHEKVVKVLLTVIKILFYYFSSLVHFSYQNCEPLKFLIKIFLKFVI